MKYLSYRLWLWISYIVGVVILGNSDIRHLFMSEYQGVHPYRGPEEGMYLNRLQEALMHPFSNVSNGIMSGIDVPAGLQMAEMERIVGTLFSWTGLTAYPVAFLVTVLIAPLFIPLCAAFARRLGAVEKEAIIFAIFGFFLQAFLMRFFHPSWDMPLAMGGLLCVFRWWEKPTVGRAIIAGVLLGMLPGIYFWSWTYVWLTISLMGLGVFILEKKTLSRPRLIPTGVLLVITILLVAAPALWQIISSSMHPLYEQASYRAGLAHTRIPESIPRSIFLLVLTGGAFWIWGRDPKCRMKYGFVLCSLLSLLIANNQQMVHGIVMSFSSHYYPYVILFAWFLVLIFWREWRMDVPRAIILLCCAFVSITAVTDAPMRRYVFFLPESHEMRFQHLAPVLDRLADDPVQTVLTDKFTADFVASTTNDDVVYTSFTPFLLISDQESDERLCLSQVFSPVEMNMEIQPVHSENRYRVSRGQLTQEEHEQNMEDTLAVCEVVKSDVAHYLSKYGVDLLLWNKKEHPDWKIPSGLFELVEEGEGWGVWDIR